MKNNRIMWLSSLIPALVTACFMPFMSDAVPMHYNIGGEIDRWGSKYENFIFPALILLFTVFWALLIRWFDSRAAKAGDEKSRAEALGNVKVLRITAVSTAAIFTVIQCGILIAAMNAAAPVSGNTVTFVTNISLGVLMIVLGNILPKARRNALVGVRTSWSMKNDRTWAVSNRSGGIAFAAAGALTIILGAFFTGTVSMFILLALILAATAISLVCSYCAFKKYGGIDDAE